jgi:hypothetical protein
MAQNVDLFLRSGQTINLEFEHFLVHRTGNDLRAIEFQPRQGAPQLVFADVSDVVAVLIHDGDAPGDLEVLGDIPTELSA